MRGEEEEEEERKGKEEAGDGWPTVMSSAITQVVSSPRRSFVFISNKVPPCWRS